MLRDWAKGTPLSLRSVIAVVVALAFVGWVVAEVPFDRLSETLLDVSPLALLGVAVIFLVQQLLRAWRQQILVNAVVEDSSYRGNLSVLCMSFFCINTFPARMGELVRPALLLEKENVPLGTGFSVVFVERIIDLAVALGVLLCVLFFMDLPATTVEVNSVQIDFLHLIQAVALGVVLPVFALLLFLVVAPQKGLSFVRGCVVFFSRVLPQAHRERLQAMADGFAESFLAGISVLRKPKKILAVLGLTAVTWGGTGFLYVVLAEGFSSLQGEIGWTEGMAILVITMLGTAIPALPGFAAVYEGAVVAAFVLLGIGARPEVEALAFALVVHWWTYAVQSMTAFYFFAKDGVSLSRLRAGVRRSQSA